MTSAATPLVRFGLTVVILLIVPVLGDDMKDVVEGDNVTLECRFAPHLISRGRETLYWQRTNARDKDNVAIGETPLDTNYAIDYRPAEGRYDLKIHNATYDRDNGKFDCRIKASGSGAELHSKIVQLTVLLPPGDPKVIPSEPTATEGRVLELSCSSSGGSPDPLIRWYRNGMNYPLDSIVKNGGSKLNPTSAILSITPVRDDDGSEYRCVVWNRALGEGVKLEKIVTLNVNYFPRVKVGPENPLRVEKGSPAKLHCNVDSKPAVSSVRWTRNGKFSETTFTYTIPRTSLSDAGTYQCSAENGLGQSGEADLSLDVLYAPIVSVTSSKEYAEGETAWIKCNVTSNPKPSSIEWIKKDDPTFHHYGDILKIESVTAGNAGVYVCKATNILNPSGDVNPYERTGNATVALLIKHAPVRTVIEPSEPSVVEGSGVTLTCRADPPGWPLPQFRWWREGAETTVGVGSQFNIGAAKVSSEGKYFCQPHNEIGTGDTAVVFLRVFQPPRFSAILSPQTIRRTGERNFSIMCAANGIPTPRAIWMKDNVPLESDPNFKTLYTVENKEIPESHRVVTLQSTLHFSGEGRDTIMAEDRGYYTCVFENEVKKEESHMYLRIQNKPLFRRKHDLERVAFDIEETAKIPCKVQAFPKPEFDWFFDGKPLVMDVKNYETNLTILQNDVYISLLFVKGVRREDYGEYICRATNSMGNSSGVIMLQEKGHPAPPTNLATENVGVSYALLKYEPGFNGGYENTKYFISYTSENDPRQEEFDCQNFNPCNVTGLEQKTVYVFKIKAHNSKGNSDYSAGHTVMTRVDLSTIPDPLDVKFEPKSGTLLFNNIGPIPIRAKVEVQDELGSWRKYRMLVVDTDKFRTQIQDEKVVENVRVTHCVDENSCGRTINALLVNDIPAAAPVGVRVHYVIAGVVSGVVLLLCFALIIIFCCCRKKKVVKKDYETGRGHQTQVVPPPYYSKGMENKALERNMDLMEDTIKNYNGPNGYIYNGHVPNGNGAIPYIDQNSYSNSNNGGSVDSQDSLWKVTHVPNDQMSQQSHQPQHQHGNYEQYAPPDESYVPCEARNSYVTDPYGPIPKPKRRLDLIGDHSPYHDLSGLPDPYLDPYSEQVPHAHSHQHRQPNNVPMSFEETMESGYSTPSSRNRRVIREIIV